MKIRTFEYFIKEALVSLRRNSLLSIASISTVAVSLFILGVFVVLVMNLNHMASAIESQVQISVFLNDQLEDKDFHELGGAITQIEGVREVKFVSKEEALARFRERLGEQQGLLEAMGETNPLPNAFEVSVASPDQVKQVAEELQGLPGVEKVRYGKEVVEKLFSLTRMVRTFGLILIAFLALAALFIIANTIRITVFARRREIGIMKFVGATDWFIRWPFLIEGIILGFSGALVAALILSKCYQLVTHSVYQSLPFLPILSVYPLMLYLNIGILLLGTLIGALGSTISLRRFLQV